MGKAEAALWGERSLVPIVPGFADSMNGSRMSNPISGKAVASDA